MKKTDKLPSRGTAEPLKTVWCNCGKKSIEIPTSYKDRYVCWVCVQKIVGPPKITTYNKSHENKIKHPRGWKFMKEYVDIQRNVYHKGILQPKLKGTKEPTTLPDYKSLKQDKLSKKRQRQIIGAKIYDLKKELSKAKTKKHAREIEQQIKQFNKQMQ